MSVCVCVRRRERVSVDVCGCACDSVYASKVDVRAFVCVRVGLTNLL